ncbi:hypothetical protein ZHAS_00012265 [Anopheles sinensis]|uniref:Uncharacterized protein n=1 Tax=Anopheles sinensis TaxID=74873 RepID=A0A084W2N2_ANOSI|nr:hypothetical protein ZHAS_00012265 [Anopheles sinensis]
MPSPIACPLLLFTAAVGRAEKRKVSSERAALGPLKIVQPKRFSWDRVVLLGRRFRNAPVENLVENRDNDVDVRSFARKMADK